MQWLLGKMKLSLKESNYWKFNRKLNYLVSAEKKKLYVILLNSSQHARWYLFGFDVFFHSFYVYNME